MTLLSKHKLPQLQGNNTPAAAAATAKVEAATAGRRRKRRSQGRRLAWPDWLPAEEQNSMLQSNSAPQSQQKNTFRHT
jgi:hypothetical protein